MFMKDFDEERYRRLLREEYREEGLAEGRAEGRAKGIAEGRAEGIRLKYTLQNGHDKKKGSLKLDTRERGKIP